MCLGRSGREPQEKRILPRSKKENSTQNDVRLELAAQGVLVLLGAWNNRKYFVHNINLTPGGLTMRMGKSLEIKWSTHKINCCLVVALRVLFFSTAYNFNPHWSWLLFNILFLLLPQPWIIIANIEIFLHCALSTFPLNYHFLQLVGGA